MYIHLICILIVLVKTVAASRMSNLSIPCIPCHCFQTKAGIKADCSNKKLNHIPKTIPTFTSNLQMNCNKLNSLPNRSFFHLTQLKALDLSGNDISSMAVGAFTGLYNLETLNLYGNSLTLHPETYRYGLFKDLNKLTTLDISKNDNKNSIHSSYPHKTFSDLFSLRNLLMDGLENFTLGEGFANLTHLTNLNLSGHRGYCSIYQLLNNSFIHVSSLEYLNVSKCILGHIDTSSFKPLRHIDTLDVSNNKDLGLDKFATSLYGLQHSKIRVLRANELELTFAIGVYLNVSNLKYLKNTNLKELYIDSNRIELIDPFIPTLLPQVEVISMRYNRITFGLYILALNPMVNLRVLDASGQYRSNEMPFHFKNWKAIKLMWNMNRHTMDSSTYDLSSKSGEDLIVTEHWNQKHDERRPSQVIPWNERHGVRIKRSARDTTLSSKNSLGYKITIPIPPNMTLFNTSHCKMSYELYELVFTHNKIKIIDMSYNLFTKWIGPYHPLDNLEEWYLSNNYCTEIGSLFLKNSSSLKLLDISNNLLGSTLKNDSNGKIFEMQVQLKTLNIANNIIHELPNDIFKGLENLRMLDVSWNIMSTWEVTINHMSELRYLNLTYNILETIPNKLQEEIDKIMSGKDGIFHINLKGNILKCDCRTLTSLRWLTQSYLTIDDAHESMCYLTDGTTVTLDQIKDIVLDLQKKCKTSLPLIFGSVSGIIIFLAVLVGGLLYRYRWQLRYLYYTTRRKHRGYQRLTGEDNFTYDAFVSYADDDREFVVNKMRYMLEERYGLKLCIHHRDFLVGQEITANIIDAVQTSRKTIVLLSPNFVRSAWCNYEVHMARFESIHTGRNVLCVLWYKDVPRTRDISNDLLQEIATGTYIQYTDNEDGEELFWTSLRDAIIQ